MPIAAGRLPFAVRCRQAGAVASELPGFHFGIGLSCRIRGCLVQISDAVRHDRTQNETAPPKVGSAPRHASRALTTAENDR